MNINLVIIFSIYEFVLARHKKKIINCCESLTLWFANISSMTIDRYLIYYGAWFVMIFGLSGNNQNSCNRPRGKLLHPSLSQ